MGANIIKKTLKSKLKSRFLLFQPHFHSILVLSPTIFDDFPIGNPPFSGPSRQKVRPSLHHPPPIPPLSIGHSSLSLKKSLDAPPLIPPLSVGNPSSILRKSLGQPSAILRVSFGTNSETLLYSVRNSYDFTSCSVHESSKNKVRSHYEPCMFFT